MLFKGFGIIAAARKADGSVSGQSADNPESSSSLPVKSKPNSKKRFIEMVKK